MIVILNAKIRFKFRLIKALLFPLLDYSLSKIMKEIQFAKCAFNSPALQSFAGPKKCLGTYFCRNLLVLKARIG